MNREVDGCTALAFCKERLSPYKRIRCVEFAELPKTISGKIRRVQLRAVEKERRAAGQRAAGEYWLDDLERGTDGTPPPAKA